MRKKIKKKKREKNYSVARWLFTAAVLIIVFFLNENQSLEGIQSGETPVFYSNICNDNLEDLFLQAIEKAERSIFLVIYSFTDSKLLTALNKQAQKGVEIKIYHDLSTPDYGWKKLSKCIEREGIKTSGLMHQKILVVDGEKIFIGSANFTRESLKLHDNLVIGLINRPLAEAIIEEKGFATLNIQGEKIEFWSLPEKGKEGLKRLVELINSSKKTIRVAMFTWTHAALTEAVINAHQRGVKVEILLDQGQAHGVCSKTLQAFRRAGVDVRLNSGLGLLHHKFAWIDEETLVNGSANWTVSAFTRNRDCFLILYPLTEKQKEKLEELWRKTKITATEELLPLAA